MKLDIFGNTIIGKVRDHNEDSFVLCPDLDTPDFMFSPTSSLSFEINGLGSLMCVADGMGGTNAGEVASYEAIQFIKNHFSDKSNYEEKEIEEVLTSAIIKANEHLIDYVKSHPESEGMGTTMVLSIIKKDNLSVAWTGDSRCYVCNDDNYPLYPFTDDHSMVWELVQANQMSAEQARVHPNSNIITQSLGDSVNKPNPSFKSTHLKKDDIVILCSDGLNGMISDSVIEEIIKEEGDSKDICNKLINEANKAGGEDNITVIITKILDTDNLFVPLIKDSINTKQLSNKNNSSKKLKFVLPLFTALVGVFIGYLLFGSGWGAIICGETPVVPIDSIEVVDTINGEVDSPGAAVNSETGNDTTLKNDESDNPPKNEKIKPTKKVESESKPKVEESKPSNKNKKVEEKTTISKEKQVESSLNTDEEDKEATLTGNDKGKLNITKIDNSTSKEKQANSDSKTGVEAGEITRINKGTNKSEIENSDVESSQVIIDTTSSSK